MCTFREPFALSPTDGLGAGEDACTPDAQPSTSSRNHIQTCSWTQILHHKVVSCYQAYLYRLNLTCSTNRMSIISDQMKYNVVMNLKIECRSVSETVWSQQQCSIHKTWCVCTGVMQQLTNTHCGEISWTRNLDQSSTGRMNLRMFKCLFRPLNSPWIWRKHDALHHRSITLHHFAYFRSPSRSFNFQHISVQHTPMWKVCGMRCSMVSSTHQWRAHCCASTLVLHSKNHASSWSSCACTNTAWKTTCKAYQVRFLLVFPKRWTGCFMSLRLKIDGLHKLCWVWRQGWILNLNLVNLVWQAALTLFGLSWHVKQTSAVCPPN